MAGTGAYFTGVGQRELLYRRQQGTFVLAEEWRSTVRYPRQPPVSRPHATQRAAELFVEGEVEHGDAAAGVVQRRLVTEWETVG